MKIQYIAGRPLTINGDQVEVGATLTKDQIDSIPRLESYISGRFIFPVMDKKDIKRLPNFLYRAYITKSEAIEKATASGPNGELTAAVEAHEAHLKSRQVEKAENEARIQVEVYYGKSDGSQPPAPVTDPDETAPESDETAPEAVDDTQEAVADTPEENEPSEAVSEVVVQSEVFDPSEHSVAVVKDYISEHPAEAEAILKAEAEGKARKGLLEG